jgi:NTP pyrophosphatase (non-canonical NTP hydrolase)
MGMVTEAGEILDMLKKHIFYGKELDFVNLEEEMGDSNWYQSVMIQAMREMGFHTSWELIWNKNVCKLRQRYGDKFTETSAINRDLDAERATLEGND